MSRLARFRDRYLETSVERPGRWLILFFLVTILAFLSAARLGLKTDFVELLPSHYTSVQTLKTLIDRTGGMGTLLVAIEGENFENNRRFVDEAAEALARDIGDDIQSIQYKAENVEDHFPKHGLLYVGSKDLNDLEEALTEEIASAKLRANPFWLDFSDTGKAPRSRWDDWKDRANSGVSEFIETVEGYFGTDNGRMLVMVLRPKGSNLDVSGSKRLVRKVRNTLESVQGRLALPGVQFGLCGNVQSSVDEFETVRKDIFSTALLCITLVAAALLLYFKSPWIVGVLTVALLVPVTWTFGVMRLFYPYLNTQSAFLASLIVGTGINYGVILLSRFLFEQREGKMQREAIMAAGQGTFSATFLASATTAVSFLALTAAQNKGMSQFGWMGASGVLFCWLGSFLLLPPLLSLLGRLGVKLKPRGKPWYFLAAFGLASWRHVHATLAIALVMFAVALGIGLSFLPDSKETDLTKLRNQVSVESGSEALEKRVSKVFGRSLTPAVVLTDSVKESLEVCPALRTQSQNLPVSWVSSCKDSESLLPSHQDEKLVSIARVRKLVNDPSLNFLSGEKRADLERLRKKMNVRRLTLDDIPYELRQAFEEKDGTFGRLVFVYPKPGNILSKEPTLKAFSDEVGNIRLPDGKIVHAAGEPMILSDLFSFLNRDGPLITLLSFISVVLMIALISRSRSAAVGIIATLTFGFVWMWAMMATLSMKVNFFNFVALPLAFGICVDYAANLSLRLKKAAVRSDVDFRNVYAHAAGAVTLCSITTIIGYSSLLLAHNRAVASFGKLALIGELTAIGSALLLIPAFHKLLFKPSESVPLSQTAIQTSEVPPAA